MKVNRSDYVLRKKQVYGDKTHYTYYCQKVKKAEKKWVPYIDPETGCVMRMNTETGEIKPYLRNMVKGCKQASVNRSLVKLAKLLGMNDFDFFVTLTFSPNVCDRTDEEQTLELYKKYMNKLKHIEPNIRYIAVPERHKRDGAIHFHLLIGGIHWRKLGLTISGKVCCHWATHTNGICDVARFEIEKSKHILEPTDGMTIYNVSTYHYGFATCSIIRDKKRTSTYVKKYINKAFGTTKKFKKRFYYSSNLKLPEEFTDLVFTNSKEDRYFDTLQELAGEVDGDFDFAKNVVENYEFGTLQYEIPSGLQKLRDDGWNI